MTRQQAEARAKELNFKAPSGIVYIAELISTTHGWQVVPYRKWRKA